MGEQEKNDKESIICSTPKPSRILSEIIGVSSWPSSSPDLNPFHYAIWGILKNKTNANSYPNIGSLKTYIEEE